MNKFKIYTADDEEPNCIKCDHCSNDEFDCTGQCGPEHWWACYKRTEDNILRVIVAGSRTFNNFEKLEYELMMYFKSHQLHRKDIEIISGTARGADQLGEVFAKKYGLALKKFPADWNTYGKFAGYIRNEKMAKYAQSNGILFAFWDGKSKGTKHMIDLANKYNLEINIINI